MKKHYRQIESIILILIGLAFIACNSPKQDEKEGILLRYNPKIGEPITFKTTIEQSMDLIQSTTNMNMTMVMTATEKTDSLVTTLSHMEEMSFTSNMMGQTVSFDSKHMEDADPTLVESFSELLDKDYEIVYDIYGNAVSMPEDFPNSDQGIAAIFPKEKIHKGSEWTIETDNKVNDMEMHIVMTYTVKEISKEKTNIELNGTVKSDLAEGEMTGDMVIDNSNGIPMNCKINMPLTISGISVNQTITITTE